MQSASYKKIKTLVLIAMLSATVTGGKLALMAVPNVEIVTLFLMLYTVVFGLSVGLPVTLVFVTVEILIFGINTWLVSYYIHWTVLAVVTALFKKIGRDKFFVYPIIACVMSALFGVTTTFIDTLFMVGSSSKGFFEIFGALYTAGISFFVVHTVSNTLIVGLAFLSLRKLLESLKKIYFKEQSFKSFGEK